MRATSRLFATVKSASKYLEPHTPTGLTGLSTHPSPRPALIYTYRETLKRLKALPKTSVYRQATEALTKQRLEVVEAVKPEGYEQWMERVRKQIDANPAAYSKLMHDDGTLTSEKLHVDKVDVWDGQVSRQDSLPEGSNSKIQAERKAAAIRKEVEVVDKEDKEGRVPEVEDLEVEPPLTRAQVEEIEKKIGAGLIEEVVQVAEGELALVDEMLRHKVWEELEEQSPPGQWVYFERGDRV
ncbi:hypothetical protein HRR83_001805 [Exophiala dermatitidis]|uniref:NADH dehydrogenase (Ubiquinone) 1 alpha subcomplex 5 n=2 Tax=Exophiala dermatitidis TaxID=5970 RepID=H6C533_EXODN|nr:NADH dehydrogenase (ubiquinone) 1 alpha subcomplex 5 [Exophiala dermatitidis NIH/UT8656]KAJ4516471.1 hypothetical protein HRR73_004936 [Exophiala dermatitidis]EHY58934.1 NADH dehydrogenase (ubiquinone) 1 alpha subcomplex 5 [Exophiala dermatitidis NIH/UT8656]KAJ4523263.1 hypothetical protein HRR75_001664 [Exophiala dermatitidis]KAJ4526608.1 hypothetical protein HRR74_001808 [Exophiala dermatitidis]KAJ4532144.1 hypothetical protein HRR76_007143 [Exophiala dermatitidis]